MATRQRTRKHRCAYMTKIRVRASRHGTGVFAAYDISAGEEILTFSGPLVRTKDLPTPYGPRNDYFLQIGEDLFLGPSGDVDDYVNHSCAPNAGVVVAGNSILLIATCHIRAGGEIFFDYSSTMDNSSWQMECACGSSLCRGMIGDFLDLSTELQEKYVRLGIVPEYILRKWSGKRRPVGPLWTSLRQVGSRTLKVRKKATQARCRRSAQKIAP